MIGIDIQNCHSELVSKSVILIFNEGEPETSSG
jgi:hypothetical protein